MGSYCNNSHTYSETLNTEKFSETILAEIECPLEIML